MDHLPDQNGVEPHRSTLTPAAIIELARRGKFLSVAPQSIADKSKADFIAKFLVCFQVSFLVIEVCHTQVQIVPGLRSFFSL